MHTLSQVAVSRLLYRLGIDDVDNAPSALQSICGFTHETLYEIHPWVLRYFIMRQECAQFLTDLQASVKILQHATWLNVKEHLAHGAQEYYAGIGKREALGNERRRKEFMRLLDEWIFTDEMDERITPIARFLYDGRVGEAESAAMATFVLSENPATVRQWDRDLVSVVRDYLVRQEQR